MVTVSVLMLKDLTVVLAVDDSINSSRVLITILRVKHVSFQPLGFGVIELDPSVALQHVIP